MTSGKHNFIALPIYGERKGVEKHEVDGKERVDTIYHTLPAFALINHNDEVITEKFLDSNIVVADFFFTSCQTICPKMNTSMKYLQDRFKDYRTIKFISFSVNPTVDTAEVLQAYATKIHASTKNWSFVTGDKKAIYDLAIEGFLLPVAEDPRVEGGFLHSENLVLLDKDKRIRGFYDGTQIKDVNKLIDDIKLLQAEEIIKRKK